MQRLVKWVLMLKVTVVDMVALDIDFDSKQAGATLGTRTTGTGQGSGKLTSIAPIPFRAHYLSVLMEGHPSGHTVHDKPFNIPTDSLAQEYKNILQRPFSNIYIYTLKNLYAGI